MDDKHEGLSSAEIRPMLERLQAEKDAIAAQVSAAKRTAAAEGVYANHEWLTSAENAMRHKGRQIGKLQSQLSDAIKREKQERNANPAPAQLAFERLFMYGAREILPRSLYEQVMLAATEAMVV